MGDTWRGQTRGRDGKFRSVGGDKVITRNPDGSTRTWRTGDVLSDLLAQRMRGHGEPPGDDDGDSDDGE